MFVMKLLGKIIALPMILVLTILFYVVTILSRIYGLAAIAFNLAIMLCTPRKERTLACLSSAALPVTQRSMPRRPNLTLL